MDEAFQTPDTNATTFPQIAKDIDPAFSAPDDGYFRRSGTSGFARPKVDRGNGTVMLDASSLKPGQFGSRFCRVAEAYARNNGLKFVGDDAGFSRLAMLRRTENMISATLRARSTNHIELHPDQSDVALAQSMRVRPIAWRPGDHDHNLHELLLTSLENVQRRLPIIKRLAYDFEHGSIVDSRTGRTVEPHEIDELAGRVGAGSAAAGRATLMRAVLTASLVRRAGPGRGDSVLAAIDSLRSEHLPESLKRILYSNDEAPPSAGLPVSDGLDAQLHTNANIGATAHELLTTIE